MTCKTVPVTNADSLLARYKTPSAISRGSPSRPTRVRDAATARSASVTAFSAGVSTGPGDMALTRTPMGETSRASDLVNPITPALAAA